MPHIDTYTKEKLTELLSSREESPLESFLMFYCEEKEQVLNDFVQKYNELWEAHMQPLLEDERLEFETYPKKLMIKNCEISSEGIYIPVGYLEYYFSGWGHPEIWEYMCLEEALEWIQNKYPALLFEGVITKIDGTAQEVSCDNTVTTRVVGNNSNYNFTCIQLAKSVLKAIYAGDQPLFFYSFSDEELIKLLDATWQYTSCKQDLSTFTLKISSFMKEKGDTEVRTLMDIELQNMPTSVLMEICLRYNDEKFRDYLDFALRWKKMRKEEICLDKLSQKEKEKLRDVAKEVVGEKYGWFRDVFL